MPCHLFTGGHGTCCAPSCSSPCCLPALMPTVSGFQEQPWQGFGWRWMVWLYPGAGRSLGCCLFAVCALQGHALGPAAASDLRWEQRLCAWCCGHAGEGKRRGQVERCQEVAVASASNVQAFITSLLDSGGLWGHGAGQEPQHPVVGKDSPCGSKCVAQLAIVWLCPAGSGQQCPLCGCPAPHTMGGFSIPLDARLIPAPRRPASWGSTKPLWITTKSHWKQQRSAARATTSSRRSQR